MRVHRYEITCYEGIIDQTHGMGKTQTRLLIPRKGVFGYRSIDKIDFFSDDPEVIAESEKCVGGESNLEGGVRYLGEVELPEETVLKMVFCGRVLNRAKVEFNAASKPLIRILSEPTK